MSLAARRLAPALLLLFAIAAGPARAQQADLQVGLTNTLPQEVNVYVAPADGGAPRFVGTMAGGASNQVQVKAGEQIVLALGQEAFQAYAVTAEPNQSVQIARQAAAPTPPAAAAAPADAPAASAAAPAAPPAATAQAQPPAAAAAPQADLQVGLTNTLPQEVNVYVAPADGGAPRFVGTMAGGASNQVQVKAGEQIVLALGQEAFQAYAVTAEPNQSVQIARQAAASTPPVAAAPPAAAAAPPAAPVTAAAPAAPQAAPPAQQQPQPPAAAAAAAGAGEMMSPPDASGLSWQFRTRSDPSKGLVGELQHGIPQSDGVQLSAICTPSQPTITLDLSAPVQGLQAGSRTEVVFYVPGFQGSLPGTVLAPKQGESLSGFRVQVALTDDLWTALQGEGTMKYGRTAATPLPLDGARPIVATFLEHCRSLGTAASVAAAGPKPVAACASASQLRSVEGPRQDVVFVNRSGEFRHLNWIDLSGQMVPVGTMQPGASLPVSSADGYTYVLTDGPGNCVEIATTFSGKSQVVLNARIRRSVNE